MVVHQKFEQDKLKSAIPIFAANDALKVEQLTNSEQELTMNVRECKFAEHFQSIGETEFGAILSCEIDPPMTATMGDDLSLSRTKTIMSGATHCDFQWRKHPS